MRRVTCRSPLTTGTALFLVVATVLFVVSCGGGNPSGPSKSATSNQLGDPFNVTANTDNVTPGSCIAAADAIAVGVFNANGDANASGSNFCPSSSGHPRTCIAATRAVSVSVLNGNANSNATSNNNCT